MDQRSAAADKSTRLSIRLGEELRRLRRRSGMTAVQVAAHLGMHSTRLSRIENGSSALEPSDVERLLDLVRAGRTDRDVVAGLMADMADHADIVTHPAGAFSLEEVQIAAWNEIAEVQHVQWYEPCFVPGHLQTFDYAASIFRSAPVGGTRADEDDVLAAVRVRMEGQTRLYDCEASFEFIVNEVALVQSPVAPEVLAKQCHHLAQLTMLPNVRLGVLPLDAVMPMHVLSGFQILDAAKVVLMSMWSHVNVTAPSAVRDFCRTFDTIAPVALYDEPARDVLRRRAVLLMQRAIGSDDVDLRAADVV